MSNKVTYAEIIEALSRETDFSKQKSEAFSKALIGLIKKALEDTGKASITNFGSFKVKRVAERQGQNPQTGQPITIPAHNRVSFTPYKALKEKVNAKYAHLETELLGEKTQEQPESETPSIEPEQKEEQPEEKVAETIFQFDEEATEENEDEKEADEVKNENPFVFDEPEEEPEPEDQPETEPEEEIEFSEDLEEPVAEEESSGKMILIMTIAAIFAVAMVSFWWFFLRSEVKNKPVQQAAVEQPRTTAPVTESSSPESEESESVQEEQVNPESALDAEEVAGDQETVDPVRQPEAESMASSEMNIYEVSQNEWFWVISEKIYGMSRFWPLIYQENFSSETHPDSLANSVKLRVPELEGTAENPTKNDYQRLAEATALVSEAYQKFGRTDKAEEYARFAKKWERLGK